MVLFVFLLLFPNITSFLTREGFSGKELAQKERTVQRKEVTTRNRLGPSDPPEIKGREKSAF
jgi:hypothetical protein